MKHIDVQPQPLLGFKRTFGIALSGVKYRLFRAMVTVAVISVAMAFLMNILAESLIKKTVAANAADQISDMRRVDRWIARLSIPQTAGEIISQASAGLDDSARANVQTAGGLSPEEVDAVVSTSKDAALFLAFFTDLDYGRRRVLVGSAEDTAIFDRLQDAGARENFFSRLADMKTLRLPASNEQFESFLSRWPALRGQIERIRAGQVTAIAGITRELGGKTVLDALRDADGEFGNKIRSAGFSLTTDEAASLADQVEAIADKTMIEDAINKTEVRQAVSARLDILPGDVTPSVVWDHLSDDESANWFLGQMTAAGYNVAGWNAGRVQILATERDRAFLLKQAELETTGTTGGLMGIGQRMTWLALVSMLVCAVGIANAMLMSVTERFREIATLKCLGALDGFIMTVFLIEASILGLVGGIIGTIIGLLISVLRMLGIFKGLLLESIPGDALLMASLLSIGIGIMLAAISAVYPSLRAARLAPMEAMRIE